MIISIKHLATDVYPTMPFCPFVSFIDKDKEKARG
jgi:hypothetical protein